MTTGRLQLLLARILMDPSLLHQVKAEPERFADQHGLDAETVRSLCGDKQGLEVTIGSTRFKKLRLAESIFPSTMAMCGELFDSDWLYEHVVAPSSFSSGAAARGMLKRLATELDTSSLPHVDATRDMARFESIWHEVGERHAEADLPMPPHPSLRPGAVLATFGRPVMELRRRIWEKEEWREVTARATHYALVPTPGTGVSVHRLPTGLRDLLGLCNGRTPLDELSRAVDKPVDTVRRALVGTTEKGITA